MSSALGPNSAPIYFPLDQGERANHLNVNQLLPRVVYERLAEMLKESLPEANQPNDDDGTRFVSERGHSTIFLDGGRGTGKTTVIVNLQKYLEAEDVIERHTGLADAVHILKPIDPSQLEDGDDLFLNVVVAAVLGDKDIKAQREVKPELWQAMHASLQTLGVALAGRETQSEGLGLDRLRAFMGAQDLARAVHDFFDKAAQLLGKRLLVLPIDDVDTTLHRAFENLEVVRRYLASPVLLPIVCGDLSLYREVAWRDAFRRLTADVRQFHEEAKPVADQLAHEYLRKIMPLHRRVRMPEVEAFLDSDLVFLGTGGHRVSQPRLTLSMLGGWLKALLVGPVNGLESSSLHISIPTVRALSQLISRVRSGIPALEEAFFNKTQAPPLANLMRRIASRRQSQTPARNLRETPPLTPPAEAPSRLDIPEWQAALLDHFVFEPSAGGVCLVLMAAQHWHERSTSSVLDTPLFKPLRQIGRSELRYIETRTELSWQADLMGRLPDSWVNTISDRAILPFATPEVGRAVVPADWRETYERTGDGTASAMVPVLIELTTHYNFYTSSKRATLICSGRVLELLVTSLVRDVQPYDIERILTTTPFHSAAGVAATQAVRFSIDEIDEIEAIDEVEVTGFNVEPETPSAHLEQNSAAITGRKRAIEYIVSEINEWRHDSDADLLPTSPWLMYCALNKTFNQVPLFTRPLSLNEQPKAERLSDVAASGLAAFNAFWAALASFEKGPLFDLRAEVSGVSLVNRRGDFTRNNMYMQNIKPLVDRQLNNDTISAGSVISATQTLDTHPLRRLFENFFSFAKEYEEAQSEEPAIVDGRALLRETLGLPPSIIRFSMTSIKKALRQNAPKNLTPKEFGERVLQQISRQHPNLSQLRTLRRAIAELDTDPSAGEP
ncbi:antiviral RADAR system adenosine triphosphatase RdrA [Burkholderia ambifaria]|uniref:antiviral RADAR system adenosine triphosphatase RdrA n=1 Tax=Burkholderia ambifaria TaxID=152480 RepID=UPI001C9354C2|nr:antiviral RADAR system adenosine triphosphatase RdrA [Burkholderia ambifaria]MBY4767332.1 KAP family NTPase [Burkholderia ambifaria]